MAVYAREQIADVWLVEPWAKLVEVYQLDGALWVRLGVYADDARARMEPFDAVETELERWWLPLG